MGWVHVKVYSQCSRKSQKWSLYWWAVSWLDGHRASLCVVCATRSFDCYNFCIYNVDDCDMQHADCILGHFQCWNDFGERDCCDGISGMGNGRFRVHFRRHANWSLCWLHSSLGLGLLAIGSFAQVGEDQVSVPRNGREHLQFNGNNILGWPRSLRRKHRSLLEICTCDLLDGNLLFRDFDAVLWRINAHPWTHKQLVWPLLMHRRQGIERV